MAWERQIGVVEGRWPSLIFLAATRRALSRPTLLLSRWITQVAKWNTGAGALAAPVLFCGALPWRWQSDYWLLALSAPHEPPPLVNPIRGFLLLLFLFLVPFETEKNISGHRMGSGRWAAGARGLQFVKGGRGGGLELGTQERGTGCWLLCSQCGRVPCTWAATLHEVGDRLATQAVLVGLWGQEWWQWRESGIRGP